MKRLIKELEDYRLERRLTQKQLAEKLGVVFATVNRWLNGHCYPDKLQAYQVKKLLKEGKKKK